MLEEQIDLALSFLIQDTVRQLPVKQLMDWVLSRDTGTFTSPFLNPSHANTLDAPYHRIIRMARKPLLWM